MSGVQQRIRRIATRFSPEIQGDAALALCTGTMENGLLVEIRLITNIAPRQIRHLREGVSQLGATSYGGRI